MNTCYPCPAAHLLQKLEDSLHDQTWLLNGHRGSSRGCNLSLPLDTSSHCGVRDQGLLLALAAWTDHPQAEPVVVAGKV